MLCLSKLEVEDMLQPNKFIAAREEVVPVGKRVFGEIVGRREIVLLNLYYLFRTVNRSTPFVLPHPLSSQRK